MCPPSYAWVHLGEPSVAHPRLGEPLHLGEAHLRLGEERQVLGIFLPKQTLSAFHYFNPKINKNMETKTRIGRIPTS